jgi:hypothetical protein
VCLRRRRDARRGSLPRRSKAITSGSGPHRPLRLALAAAAQRQVRPFEHSAARAIFPGFAFPMKDEPATKSASCTSAAGNANSSRRFIRVHALAFQTSCRPWDLHAGQMQAATAVCVSLAGRPSRHLVLVGFPLSTSRRATIRRGPGAAGICSTESQPRSQVHAMEWLRPSQSSPNFRVNASVVPCGCGSTKTPKRPKGSGRAWASRIVAQPSLLA